MDANYGEEFKNATIGLLNILKGIIFELNQDKLITFNGNAVTIIVTLLDTNSADNLIWCLASVSDNWHKIISKDSSFVTEDFPKAIRSSGLPLDTNILTCPFTCYKAISESDAWKDVDEEDWPVTSDELDDIWKRMHLLVRIACKYIYKLRNTISTKLCPQDRMDPVYANIDLAKYVRMFGVVLPSN